MVPRRYSAGVLTFEEVVALWESHCKNDNEAFWHDLFEANPRILAQAVPNCVLQMGSKCYIGGKTFENKGGNIVDFLYGTKSNKSLFLVEIKTPITPLLGRRYRENAYAMSEDLTGSVVQLLVYRDELLKSYYSLFTPSARLNAVQPQCLLIAGNLSTIQDSIQRRSFEAFRASAGVTILGYDELFAKIRDLAELIATW